MLYHCPIHWCRETRSIVDFMFDFSPYIPYNCIHRSNSFPHDPFSYVGLSFYSLFPFCIHFQWIDQRGELTIKRILFITRWRNAYSTVVMSAPLSYTLSFSYVHSSPWVRLCCYLKETIPFPVAWSRSNFNFHVMGLIVVCNAHLSQFVWCSSHIWSYFNILCASALDF